MRAPKTLLLRDVYLDLSNPRHEPYENQQDVIDYLVSKELVAPLAADIVKNKMNPLESFAVMEMAKKKGQAQKYTVAEGNRRLCALKLLDDPDLAPAKHREKFVELAAESQPISEISAIVFKAEEQDEVKKWVGRLHEGPQGGIGRKPWDADQKSRYSGTDKNALALALMDYAEANNFITKEDRHRKLTTAQRFLGNEIFREALGLHSKNVESFQRTRPKAEFNEAVKRFVTDLKHGHIDSRYNKAEIVEYARKLQATDGVTAARTPLPEPVVDEQTKPSGSEKSRPTRAVKPKRKSKLTFRQDVSEAVKAIPSHKLDSIYYSLCDIRLDAHTPLLSVGVWTFLETLTALSGRNENTDFYSFLSKQKLVSLGLTDSTANKAVVQAIKRCAEYGNTTKHHKSSAFFNGDQLSNDFDLLQDLFLHLAKDAK